MENIICSVFAKKKDDKIRYWMSVSGQTRDGKDIYASQYLTLSKAAQEIFKGNAVKTKNEAIKVFRAEITDGWFKAAPGKDYPQVYFFINDMKPAPKKEDDSNADW